ncbi:hypothetical protein GH714_014658 [Hevea brasiliensis]|uniref:Protein kinase domain-containing protein n=1 Tax=Hevea brasiliensis TaxID=3981 RepID=A0A6A6LP62_HEVBR|nr:hypothetical protein GH714_014599 [Hevea brasiliensis]KAF2303214.1 hypothetical protein GH714_014658 [Hevea brasiliensis]
MMVFEYAPNGTLFEHLHVKEMEHLDWSARMRIIMGIAYCLQYMHHDLNPPVAHSNLNSYNIFLTDDYATMIAEISFLPQDSSKSKSSGDNESTHSTLPLLADVEINVYCFGILLLEIILESFNAWKNKDPRKISKSFMKSYTLISLGITLWLNDICVLTACMAG